MLAFLCFLFPITILLSFLMVGGESRRKATAVSPLIMTLRVMTWLSNDSLHTIHPPNPVELFINLSLHNEQPDLGSFAVPVADRFLEDLPGWAWYLLILISSSFDLQDTRLWPGGLWVWASTQKRAIKIQSNLMGTIPSLQWAGGLEASALCEGTPPAPARVGADRPLSLFPFSYQNFGARSYCSYSY